MGKDQLFKTVISQLLREFLELFYPDVAARLDFETTRFLFGVERRRAGRVRTAEGEQTVDEPFVTAHHALGFEVDRVADVRIGGAGLAVARHEQVLILPCDAPESTQR